MGSEVGEAGFRLELGRVLWVLEILCVTEAHLRGWVWIKYQAMQKLQVQGLAHEEQPRYRTFVHFF